MRDRRTLLVLLLTAIALATRAVVAFRGGIWADEAFFMALVRTDSWSEMMSFLHFHESHPPLFYAIMRVWLAIFGDTDTAALILTVIIGAAIVPTAYFVGRSLFSERAGLIGAALMSIASGLVEYAAQLRPYGLLPVLVLASCYFLVRMVETGGWRAGFGYVVSTLLMVYTHNWVWLVVAAQAVAAAIVLMLWKRSQRPRVVRDVVASWVMIGVVFLPWIPAFLFQAAHAGHRTVAGTGLADSLQLILFGVLYGPEMILLGTLAKNGSLMMLTAGAVALVTAVLSALLARRTTGTREQHSPLRTPHSPLHGGIGGRFFLLVLVATVIIAAAFSSVSYLLIGRCLIMLGPLGLLAFAAWVDRVWSRRAERSQMIPLAGGLFGLVLTIFSFGMYWAVQAPRSNSREVAVALKQHMRPADLLIVAPEWYAPAFNHYFPPSIRQIDFPYRTRTGLTDFSNVWPRTSDSVAISWVSEQIESARRSGRRTWLISGPKQLRAISAEEVELARQRQDAELLIALRVHQIRDLLIAKYGQPDRSASPPGPRSRYNELILELYSTDTSRVRLDE